MENRLPEYGWYVRNIGGWTSSHPVIKYLNEKFEAYFDGDAESEAVYGITNRGDTRCSSILEGFGPYAEELTLEQFLELTSEQIIYQVY